MTELDLGGPWALTFPDISVQDEPHHTITGRTITAQVPGSVLQTFLQEGIIEDPFYRDNERIALQLANATYRFSRSFDVMDDFLLYDAQLLVCDGLDTLAHIFINGEHVADTDNMHRTYELDVRGVLKAGLNQIEIQFDSPIDYISTLQAQSPLWGPDASVAGFPHIRKAHYMFGWDWGPQIPDAGIWRRIAIRGFHAARLEDVLVRQIHDADDVRVEVDVTCETFGQESTVIRAILTSPDGHEQKTFCVLHSEEAFKHTLSFEVQEPALWWPNGYGNQPLYSLTVQLVAADGSILDESKKRIGLRTIAVRREPDDWGESFEFVVNGQSVFAMGANYIPEDNLVSRMTREKTKRLLEDCVEAHFNMIRVWGGGFYPDETFYNLCDELGLIVWQDFMFACGVYELTPAFRATVEAEIMDNIRRFRHHASLGILCGNNEMEVAWVDWGFPKTEELRQDYLTLFEEIMPALCEQLAPQTFYWPASPSSGGGFDQPNDENRGDVHYWDVWHGQKPFTEYRKFYFRFCSEFGFQSFPSMKTIESFTLPEDRNVFSYVMEQHQKDKGANGKILWYLAAEHRFPKDFASLVYLSQVLQAEAIKYGVEHWRRHRGRCMGSIYWQLNDCWPVASWSSMDNHHRWKALHYFAKRFYAPILASACEGDTSASLHVTNETANVVEGTLSWQLVTDKGDIVERGEASVTVLPYEAVEVTTVDYTDVLKKAYGAHQHVLAYQFTANHQTVCDGVVLLTKPKYVQFANPRIAMDVQETAEAFEITLTTSAVAKYVELSLVTDDAVFSDNFFDMVPSIEKRIFVSKQRLSSVLTLDSFKAQLAVRSLYDSYEHPST